MFIVIIAISVVIMVVNYYRNNSVFEFPCFNTYGNISSVDINKSKEIFILANKNNYSYTIHFIEQALNNKISSIIYLSKDIKLIYPNNYIAKDSKVIDEIYNRLALDNHKDYLLQYSVGGVLSKVMEIISNNHKQLTDVLINDLSIKNIDIDPIVKRIKSKCNKSKDTILFFTQRVQHSCACYNIMKSLINYLNIKHEKLVVYRVGENTKNDIYNFAKEFNNDILVREDSLINRYVNDWNNVAERYDFNAIVIKSNNECNFYPLLTIHDYESWMNMWNNKKGKL